MNFTTLYGVGGTAWVMARVAETSHVACACCNSTGEMTINGEVLRCPKCSGRKTSTGVMQTIAMSMVVSQVNVCADISGNKIRYSGTREDGKSVSVLEADAFATKALAEASLEQA